MRYQKPILIVVILVLGFTITVLPQSKANPEAVTADDYMRAVSMLSQNTSKLVDRMPGGPVWLPDGRFWYRVLSRTAPEFVLVDPARSSRKTAAKLSELGVSGNAARSGRRRGRGSTVRSPDGKLDAFIRDHNLWVRDLKTGSERRLTKDGVRDFGYATDNAGWRKSDRPVLLWSPDSSKIATFQQDQRGVSDMYLVTTNVGEPRLQAWKYPLPGDKVVTTIQRVIIDVASGKTVRLKMPPDQHRSTLCDDISCSGHFVDNEWSADSSTLAFVSSSRDHKTAKLKVADAATGEVRDVFGETVATQFESGRGSVNWKYLPGSGEFIWYSERSDWGHLYLYDLKTGRLKNRITRGNWVVTRVLTVDRKNKMIYFLANGREKGRDPYFSHFYRVGFDGNGLTLLTPEDGNHRVSLSPDGGYFVDSYSTPDMPPVAVLRDAHGKLMMTLEKTDISRLTATGWKPPMRITVKARDGKTDLYGLMFTPTNLDPGRKYPIINYIYPGPQGGSVGSRSFSPGRRDHQALAEVGFVVMMIDGTCNPGRSKSFHDACYGNMADNTLADQVGAMKQLAARFPYIDIERTGIWGHSGGGFATAAAMFRYPDFFKVGISESGNHDNRNYEDDWGERYIGLLKKDASGKSNYEAQANQNIAKNLKGKLLLAHGGLDNNVPPYNTYLVVDALIKANKDFDLIIFPNARHGYGSARNYMMRRRWDYFVRNLLGKEPPKEFRISFERDPRLSRRSP